MGAFLVRASSFMRAAEKLDPRLYTAMVSHGAPARCDPRHRFDYSLLADSQALPRDIPEQGWPPHCTSRERAAAVGGIVLAATLEIHPMAAMTRKLFLNGICIAIVPDLYQLVHR